MFLSLSDRDASPRALARGRHGDSTLAGEAGVRKATGPKRSWNVGRMDFVLFAYAFS